MTAPTRRNSRAATAAACLVAFVALAAGCATSTTPQPTSMRDPQANFASYATFGWTAPGAADANDAPLKLLDSNLRAAIAAEMKNVRCQVFHADMQQGKRSYGVIG